MFKFLLLAILCGVVLAESKPTQYTDNNNLHNYNFRVVRSAQLAQNAMNMAGQIANDGIQAAVKGLNIVTAAAQQGISAGTSIAAQAVKSATSII